MPTSAAVKVKLVPGHYSSRARVVWPRGFKRTLLREARHAQLIHDNGVWQANNHLSAHVARQLKLPLIITPRGMLEPWALKHRAWKKKLAWHLFQRRDLATACVLHATSSMEAEGIRSSGLRQPIAVIPNGVDLPESLQAAQFPVPRRTILFLSRIHPKKGLLNLVRAWGCLRPRDWHIVIAGPDENGHRAEVEAEIRSRKLSGDFTFVGPAEGTAKWRLFQQADLFVLPTFSENFGLVIAEALACGVPVITTRGAPWAELEIHRCGWWVEIGVEPLASALSDALATSQAQRMEMGARGRELVRRQYSWSGVAESMFGVYEWVLNGGACPPCVLTG